VLQLWQRQMGLSNGGQQFVRWSCDHTARLRPVMGGLSLPKLRIVPRAVYVVFVANRVAVGQASVLPCHIIQPLSQTRITKNQLWVTVPRSSTAKGVTVSSQVPSA
jgi:hypothetical protein